MAEALNDLGWVLWDACANPVFVGEGVCGFAAWLRRCLGLGLDLGFVLSCLVLRGSKVLVVRSMRSWYCS